MEREPSQPLAARSGQPPAGLWGNRAFVLLWAAYGVSAMGDHISEMALLKTQNALEADNLVQLQALITFMFMFPFFVLGPINGMLADRLPRRGVMIFADGVRALLMFNFAWLISRFEGFGPIGAFTPLLIVGVFAALFSPARAALLPSLIRENQLIRANAMTSGLGVIATMIAVLIGGFLARYYHPSVSFHIDAGTFLLSAVLLFFIRPPAEEKQRQRSGAGWSALVEAVRYVRDHRRIGQLIFVALVVWSCGAVVRSAIPAVVRDVYDRPDYLEIGGFQARLGVGMLLGSVMLTALGNALRSEIAITWSLAGTATAIGLMALSVFAPISSTLAYHLGGFAVILSGIFAVGAIASYNALLQRIAPNRLLGRLFGLTDLVSMAGLLLATGLLGIPHWPNIDRWVGWILLGMMAIVGSAAAGSLWVRLRSTHFKPGELFVLNFNGLYCRWWFRLKREGICRIPVEGPVLVVARHTSAIDPILLQACTPYRKIGFLIAAEFSNLPLAGHLTRMVECVPINRNGHDAGGTKAALRHLKSGKVLGIFIEGRIPDPGQPAEAKDGAAMLALRTGATVIPARISGTRHTDGVAGAFFLRHRARVRFGRPIDLDDYRAGKPTRDTVREVTKVIVRHLDELAEVGGEPP